MCRRNTTYWNWVTPILIALILLMLLRSSQRSMALSPQVTPDGPGSIAGRVTDMNGAPITGLEVALYRPGNFYPTLVTTTQADGAYRFPIVSAGNYIARFFDAAEYYQTTYYPNAGTLTAANELVVSGNQLTGIDMMLPLGSHVTGIITATGHALVNGSVTLHQKVDYQKVDPRNPLLVSILPVSQTTGEFHFKGVAPGAYYICASGTFSTKVDGHRDYTECYDNQPLQPLGNATPITVAQSSTLTHIDLFLGDRADLAAVTGTVVTPNGEKLSNVYVTLYDGPTYDWFGRSRHAITNNQGQFTISYLPLDLFPMTFFDNAETYYYRGIRDTAFGNDLLWLDLTYPDYRKIITVTMLPRTMITGFVSILGKVPPSPGQVTAFAQQPLQGLSPKPAIIDPKTGDYAFRDLQAGTYRLKVEATLGGAYFEAFYGGESLENAADLVVAEGERRTDINFMLGAGAYEGVITGTVTADNIPVSGIQVELWDGHPEGSTRVVYTATNSAGHYRFDGLLEQDYYMRFVDPQGHYATAYYNDAWILGASPAVHPKGGQIVADINATLIRGGSIRGRVRYHDGSPVFNAIAGAYFFAQPVCVCQAQDEVEFRTNAAGEYKISGLRPGDYHVGFSPEGFHWPGVEFYGTVASQQTPKAVRVEAGKVTSEINIILGPDNPLWLPLVQH